MMKYCKKLHKINAGAYEYYSNRYQEFKKICKPLEIIGVQDFGYMRIFKDGSYLSFNTNETYNREYFFSIAKNDELLVQKMENAFVTNQRHFFVPNDIKKYHKTDNIMQLLYQYDIWNIQNIYKISSDFLEVYCFAKSKKSDFVQEFYLNNIDLLDKFIEYFDYKASYIINIDDKSRLAHFDQSFEFHGNSEVSQFDKNVKRFMEEIKIDKKMIMGNNGKHVKLTDREIDCLNYLALGYGMKGVASILNISPRTVESYFSTVKQKTGYYTKQSVLTEFIKTFKWKQKQSISLTERGENLGSLESIKKWGVASNSGSLLDSKEQFSKGN